MRTLRFGKKISKYGSVDRCLPPACRVHGGRLKRSKRPRETNMQNVFDDIDLTTLVLQRLVAAYVEEAHRRRPCTTTLRTLLRQALRAMGTASRVCALWKRASTVAMDGLLELVAAQFRDMHVAVLDFLRHEPALYEGASLAPGVPREEAVRVLPSSYNGQTVLAPLRACFEVPVPPPPRGGGVPPPLGNVRNPIAPHGETFAQHWRPQELARHARTAGHWLRAWTAELVWVDAPTRSPKALWLATNRGCAVCGTQCVLQGRRVDLANAEHYNTQEHDAVLSFADRAPGPSRSPWVGLNAYIEVPWDLPNVHTRLAGVGVPHDPVTRLATRILPYTHRAHMVTLVFRNEWRDAAAQERSEAYKLYFTTPPGEEPDEYDQTEDEIALANVLLALETKPHPNDDRWSHGRCVRKLFSKRRDAIHESGLQKYMLENGATTRQIDKVRHATEFRATLPLVPMHGQPEAHCWCSVLDLSEAQFRRLARYCPPQPGGEIIEHVGRWREQAFRHAIAFLSERLPQFNCSCFYRVSEVGLLGSHTTAIRLRHLSDSYPSHILNEYEHARFMEDPEGIEMGVVALNRLLLGTWQDFRDLLTDNAAAHIYVLNRLHRAGNATYETMLQHFSRLDSVLGPAWRHVTRDGYDEQVGMGAQSMLFRFVLCYLRKSQDFEPAPLHIAHSRIMPGAPHHPNVWLRWFLKALVHPSETGLDSGGDREYIMEVELCNTFVVDANRQDRDRFDFENVGAHVSFYVLTEKFENGRTTPVHMRLSIGVRLSALDVIRDDVCNAKTELAEGESLGSRDGSRAKKNDLAEWHQDARVACEALTRKVRRSTPLAVDLLRRFLDVEWTPMTHSRGIEDDPTRVPRVWVEGWRALRSYCGPGCEWFANTRAR